MEASMIKRLINYYRTNFTHFLSENKMLRSPMRYSHLIKCKKCEGRLASRIVNAALIFGKVRKVLSLTYSQIIRHSSLASNTCCIVLKSHTIHHTNTHRYTIIERFQLKSSLQLWFHGCIDTHQSSGSLWITGEKIFKWFTKSEKTIRH